MVLFSFDSICTLSDLQVPVAYQTWRPKTFENHCTQSFLDGWSCMQYFDLIVYAVLVFFWMLSRIFLAVKAPMVTGTIVHNHCTHRWNCVKPHMWCINCCAAMFSFLHLVDCFFPRVLFFFFFLRLSKCKETFRNVVGRDVTRWTNY